MATGIASLIIEQVIVAKTGKVILSIEQALSASGQASLTIEQSVTELLGVAALTIEQQVAGVGSASLSLTQTVYQVQANGYGAGAVWRPVVFLNGVDVSASLTGALRVEAEEGAARIAEFVLEPVAGAVSLTDWVGASVQIDYAVLDAAGAIATQERLFTGIVDVPQYDPTLRLTTFRCTDDLQGRIAAMGRSTIDAVLGGYWSEHVFDIEAEDWQYAQDRLSTQPLSYDLTADGAGVLTSWSAKATPDFTFDADQILDESLVVDLAQRRDLVNTIEINFQFRFRRDKERQQSMTWNYPGGFCGYLDNNSELPTRQMIEDAVVAAGWLLTGTPAYTPPPGSQWIDCGGLQRGWLISDELLNTLVLGASFDVARRYSQTVTEGYTVRVRAPESVSLLGEIPETVTTAFEAYAEDDGWESAEEYTAPPSGSVVDANGDLVWDQDGDSTTGRAAADGALETLIAKARTDILAAHRSNYVEFDVLLHPALALSHTARVETDNVTAQGKVRQLLHVMDLEAGAATTTVRLAVSKSQPDGTADSAIAAPAPPNSTSTETRTGGDRIYLGTHIGGKQSSPAFDEEWTGFIGNRYVVPLGSVVYGEAASGGSNLSIEPGTIAYDRQFVVPSDGIESGARDPLEAGAESTVLVAIPDETLIMAA